MLHNAKLSPWIVDEVATPSALVLLELITIIWGSHNVLGADRGVDGTQVVKERYVVCPIRVHRFDCPRILWAATHILGGLVGPEREDVVPDLHQA